MNWDIKTPLEYKAPPIGDVVRDIQKVAFERGRNFGMRESADLFNKCQDEGKDFMVELLVKMTPTKTTETKNT